MHNMLCFALYLYLLLLGAFIFNYHTYFLLYYYCYLRAESLTQSHALSFAVSAKYLSIIGKKFTLNAFDHIEVKFNRVGGTEY